MGTILENHRLHIIHEDKTSEEITGVMIQVNDTESVFQVMAAKNCSIPAVSNTVCDHKWELPNGTKGRYNNYCEKCNTWL